MEIQIKNCLRNNCSGNKGVSGFNEQKKKSVLVLFYLIPRVGEIGLDPVVLAFTAFPAQAQEEEPPQEETAPAQPEEDKPVPQEEEPAEPEEDQPKTATPEQPEGAS